MSRNSRRKRQKPFREGERTKRQPYDRATHGEALVGFMSAFDEVDLPDGAWQAMLESGGEAFAQEWNVAIGGYDAFMEYIELSSGFQEVKAA